MTTARTLTTARWWRGRTAPVVVVAAMLVVACGNADDPSAAGAPAGATTAEDAGTSSATDDTERDQAADAADEEATAPAAAEELSPEDGWNGVHAGVDLPPPGEGLLVVDGERIDLDVTCSEGGPLASLGGAAIFAFQARGNGVDAQGREMYVEVVRRLVSVEEGERTVYEYKGQEYGSIQIVVATGDDSSPFHSSIVVTPADADPAGSKLPLVQVDESGSFTVVEDDVPPLSATIHDQALHGAVELAGSCQSGWPDVR
jgi:hypothetical protein